MEDSSSNVFSMMFDVFPTDHSIQNLLMPRWVFLVMGQKFRTDDPESLFHTLLVSLVSFSVFVRIAKYQLELLQKFGNTTTASSTDNTKRRRSGSMNDSMSSMQSTSCGSTCTTSSADEEDDTSDDSHNQESSSDNNPQRKSFSTTIIKNPAVFLWTTLITGLYSNNNSNDTTTKVSPVRLRLRYMQVKFLTVFWLLRMSFWMSGPYFYAAYASKRLPTGEPLTPSTISQISLAGFAAVALVGPFLGKVSDRHGRKLGTLLAAFLYGIGAWSTTVDGMLWILFVGRAVGGVATSLLSASPEAWLVSEFKKQQQAVIDGSHNNTNTHKDKEDDFDSEIDDLDAVSDPSWIRETFGMAYAYDSVVAMLAGQVAGRVASHRGPTGPFQVSPFFLLLGALVTAFLWEENTATSTPRSSTSNSNSTADDNKKPTIWDAVWVIQSDVRIMLLGGVQSLFEGAMYVFVMQWPPTMNHAIQRSFGADAITPYGTVFSCFMACCMVGSTLFGMLSKRPSQVKRNSTSLELSTIGMLALASLSLLLGTFAVRSSSSANNNNNNYAQGEPNENNGTGGESVRLLRLIVSYFVFEACVGIYFPTIGTLRSKYLPDSHRSLIMTLFGVPLNIIVVTVFLLVPKLGHVGALAVASIAVGLACACMVGLYVVETRRKKELRQRFKKIIRKVQRRMSFSKIQEEPEIAWRRGVVYGPQLW
ncbi:Molybdate-anion transporter [Seminavis robusta]|uniref:Molybdate-anion transporter n=1 Tax=Seminavis robusta TaxID=568900 RepID=A0A9N8EVF1_9STRA|nr:Molybdate-anion transporter [Seminavis robusta]|eukprot:Sro1798_g298250.1 Molybdate-anion transporter (704) ;mRNA; f:4410-6521